MPICPKCGKYHKKSHHRRHVKNCVGWKNPALDHLNVSKGFGSKNYETMQKQIKVERLKKLGMEV